MKNQIRMNGTDRKQAIIEAARRVFGQKGYTGTSVREIAQTAGISEALLYKHFPSKENLHKEILDYSSKVLQLSFSFTALDKLEPGAETLVKYVYLIARLILFEVPKLKEDQHWHERLLFQSLLGDITYARGHFRNFQANLGNGVAKCIKAAISAGDIEKGPIDTDNRLWFTHHLFMALNLCHMTEVCAFDYEPSKKELVRQAIFFCLRGIGMDNASIGRYFDDQKLEDFFKRLSE